MLVVAVGDDEVVAAAAVVVAAAACKKKKKEGSHAPGSERQSGPHTFQLTDILLPLSLEVATIMILTTLLLCVTCVLQCRRLLSLLLTKGGLYLLLLLYCQVFYL